MLALTTLLAASQIAGATIASGDAANAGGHRTPDRERGFDCCLRVKRSWKVQLKAGQGFGGLVC